MIQTFAALFVFVPLVSSPAPSAPQSPRAELVRPDAAPSRANAAEERVLALYEVRDLVGGSEAELAPDSGALPLLGDLFVRRNAAESGDDAAAQAREAARKQTLELGRFVLARLAPKPDASEYQLEVPAPGSLALVAKPELHQRFKAFVQDQRESPLLVDLQVRWIEGSLAEFAALGVTRESGPKALETSAEELDRTLASGRFDTLSAPRLLSHPLQRASISVMDESKYVQDWKVEKVLPGPKEIAVPVLGTLRIGQTATVRSAVLAKGDVALELAVERSKLAALRTVETQVRGAGDPRLEIALPEVQTTRVTASGLVANGGTLAFLVQDASGVTQTKDGRELLVLVTARVRSEAK